MSKLFRIFVLLFLSLILIQFSASAQNLSGNLSGSLGPGTYTVVGHCTVQSGATLTIVPGTRFEHVGNYAWTIYGQLNAEGTEASPIEFVRQQPTVLHKWKGIKFEAGSSLQSTLEWCVIDYVYTYLNGGGIYLNSVDIPIRNCTITNCQANEGGGLYADGCSDGLVIENCTFAYNIAGIGGGLSFMNSYGPVVRHCVINNNSSTNT